MTQAVIVDVVRTPSGKGKAGGSLSAVHPAELLSTVLRGLLDRNDIDPATIDDVITGCVTQGGEQSSNIGRTAALAAGLPETVPATTIDRQCGSSQQAVHFAAQGVIAGAYDIVIACGVESMSREPISSSGRGKDHKHGPLAHRYPDGLVSQGVSAELVAARWGLNRDSLDAYSVRSHKLAAAATDADVWKDFVLPVRAPGLDGAPVTISADETIRPETTIDILARLKPSFRDPALESRFPEISWSITPGNSSPLTDGASAALILSERAADRCGLRPRARFHAFSVIGSDPLVMLTGVMPATALVLERGGLTLDQIDAYEVNEAFAPVPLAWAGDMHADPDRLNPTGGAIALGHPLGASGTRLLGTLVTYLETISGRYGLQTMCEGGGMANAMVIERL